MVIGAWSAARRSARSTLLPTLPRKDLISCERHAVGGEDLVALLDAGARRRAAVIDVGDEAFPVDHRRGDPDPRIGDPPFRREEAGQLAADS